MIDTNLDVLTAAFRPRNVAVVSGHMFRGSELDEKEQAETEIAIRARAEELFAAHNVGFVYGALACGADIILAETALKAGAQFEAALPFNTERFIETSVRIGDPPGQPGKWEKRFRAILDGTHGPCTLTIMEPRDPIERDIDGYFVYGFRYAAGCALQCAAMLKTACGLIVVSDATETDTIAGANRMAADWRAHRRPFDIITYRHQRRARPIRARGEMAFRPVVFVWDGAPGAKDSPLDELSKKTGKGLDAIEHTHGGGGRSICLLTQSTVEAMTTAGEAVELACKAKHPLRVICDFGLVLGSSLRPDKKLIGRLQAADDLPGLPLDLVLATEAFAAQAKFDQGDDVALVSVGRAEVVPSTNDSARAVVRSRLSLPIFAVEPAKSGADKP